LAGEIKEKGLIPHLQLEKEISKNDSFNTYYGCGNFGVFGLPNKMEASNMLEL